MSESTTWAVVPVKRFSAAKARLAPVLDIPERIVLARLMFEDVLDSVMQCNDVLAGAIVATSDENAAAIGRSRGAKVVGSFMESGINAAIIRAGQQLQEQDGMIVVPSDIPQVSPSTLAIAARAISAQRTLALAAAVEDGGTNLLACRPAAAMPLCFGRRSFDRHRDAALRAGLTVQLLDCQDLSLDIDRPEDLETFLKLNSKTRTHAFLLELGIRERLQDCPPERDTPQLAAAGARRER